jgi:hypothetical protein
MVHALEEVRRVLRQNSILIDLRPLAGGWPVELASARERRKAGRVTDLEQGLADDAAANGAMRQAEASALFVREQEDLFPFYYYWDSPSEMQKYVEEEWTGFARIEEDVWRGLRSSWAIADADARVRIRVDMLITRWRRSP